MYFTAVESDQLYTWSDENTEAAHGRTAKTPQRSPAPLAPAANAPMVLAMAQILSVGQLSGIAATNGLCAAGIVRTNGGVPVELPPDSRDLRSDLRDQPRTAASSRGALKGCHERSAFCPPRTDRCKIGRRASRQYARRLARRQPRGSFNYGDSR